MNQQCNAPPADGDFTHYVARLGEQRAESAQQLLSALTFWQAVRTRLAVRLAVCCIVAILLACALTALLSAWQLLHEAGSLPALLALIVGASIPLILLALFVRILRRPFIDVLQMLERNAPDAHEP